MSGDETSGADDPASNAHLAARFDDGTEQMPANHCPFCGESIGSFWGRRGEDGSYWCESCQVFFRVSVTG